MSLSRCGPHHYNKVARATSVSGGAWPRSRCTVGLCNQPRGFVQRLRLPAQQGTSCAPATIQCAGRILTTSRVGRQIGISAFQRNWGMGSGATARCQLPKSQYDPGGAAARPREQSCLALPSEWKLGKSTTQCAGADESLSLKEKLKTCTAKRKVAPGQMIQLSFGELKRQAAGERSNQIENRRRHGEGR